MLFQSGTFDAAHEPVLAHTKDCIFTLGPRLFGFGQMHNGEYSWWSYAIKYFRCLKNSQFCLFNIAFPTVSCNCDLHVDSLVLPFPEGHLRPWYIYLWISFFLVICIWVFLWLFTIAYFYLAPNIPLCGYTWAYVVACGNIPHLLPRFYKYE